MTALTPPIIIGLLVAGLGALRLLFHAIEHLDEKHERAAFMARLKRVLIK